MSILKLLSEGSGGRWAPRLMMVISDHTIRITTMTVVIFMICIAFSLDSCMPWMFFHQKYTHTRTAKPAAKWFSLNLTEWPA